MKYERIISLPLKNVEIDLNKKIGPFEWWRQALGQGGINSLPLPEKVIWGIKKLKPRMVRIFIQEFFNIYPAHGYFNWDKLDLYMDALSQIGAEIVACITIKPPVLFPQVDQTVWRPNNIQEWQNVIYELVKRYSVDKKIVTYWEIGNETDIGEYGGCPYLIKNVKDYIEYYKFTMEPIRKAFPSAKIGGPAIANFEDKLFFEFIEECYHSNIQLDFISWHCYNDDPEKHKSLIVRAKKYLKKFGEKRPEMLVTEWNKMFDEVSIQELSQMSRRAASVAAIITAMMEAEVDWSFYYHIWDQIFYPEEFRPFYKDLTIMIKHWNEIPHRFGLFGVGGEVRPQYFVYQMLSRMGEERVETYSEDPDLWVNAAMSERQITIMIANYNVKASEDKIAILRFKHVPKGCKELLVYRIDGEKRWSDDLELLPVEHREIGIIENYNLSLHIYCPADSVNFIILKNKK